MQRSFAIGNYTSSGKSIGKGAFASVYLGHHKRTGEVVAIKVVDVEALSRHNEKLRTLLESEIQIMKSLQHPNIVHLYDAMVEPEYIYMILEYCAGGDFYTFIKRQGPLPEKHAQDYLNQLVSGLRFLHSKQIIHRDLKPQNLLLSTSPTGMSILKIADFGFARFINPEALNTTLCGSPLYMAPEILQGKPYNSQVDLWSVGCILIEMLTGRPIFHVKTQLELVRLLETAQINIPKALTGFTISKDCEDLLIKLLKIEVSDRITFEDFFDHPYVRIGFGVKSDPKPISNPSTNPLKKSKGWTESAPQFSNMLRDSSTQLKPPDDDNWLSVDLNDANFSKSYQAENNYMISSASSSEGSWEKISTTSSTTLSDVILTEEEKKMNEIVDVFEKVNVIEELGDLQINSNKIFEGFILFVKAGKIIFNKINEIGKWCKNNMQIYKNNVKLQDGCAKMRKYFYEIMQKAKKYRKEVGGRKSVGITAEKVMYENALTWGREAVLSEKVSKNYEKSLSLYNHGLLLLKQLLDDTDENGDRDVLQKYLSAFAIRMKEAQDLYSLNGPGFL